MLIALAGAGGFIGSKIRESFSNDTFISLNRNDLYGDITELANKIKSADVVMNFAGHPISKRWTSKNKKEIHKSRIVLTNNLVLAINSLDTKPKMFISASAIGIYAFDSVSTEVEFEYADNFMAELVKDWELAADKVSNDVRLIKVRLGMVLGKDGGAFPRLNGLFKHGLGGKIGDGKQVYSFIHIDDVIGALKFLVDKKAPGIYNFTSPLPVSNQIFTDTLAGMHRKRAFFRVPSFILKIAMGEASIIATRGQTVLPKRLLDAGYKFTFDNIEKAIGNLII